MENSQSLHYRHRLNDLDRFRLKASTVYVIIPTLNRADSLKRSIRSILAQSYNTIKIFVINCDCTDNTSAMLRDDFGLVDFLYELKTDPSVWWTEAMSIGVVRVLSECDDEDFVLSFNDDVELLGQDALSRLIDSQYEAGRSIIIGSCRDLAANKSISSGYKIDWFAGRRIDSVDLCGSFDGEQGDDLVELDILFGRGALIPVRCFHEVGNYNAMAFPHYGGDAEFSARAQQAGWKCVLDRKAVVLTSVHSTPEHAPSHIGLKSFLQALRSPFVINSPKQISKGFRLIDHCCPPRYRLMNKFMYLMTSLRYAYNQCMKACGINHGGFSVRRFLGDGN